MLVIGYIQHKDLKLIGEFEKGAEAGRDVSGKARGENSYQSYVDNYKASEEDIKELARGLSKKLWEKMHLLQI